jgi:hypothetical protein
MITGLDHAVAARDRLDEPGSRDVTIRRHGER